ncbi:MAG: M23 family metallopeptidase [Bacteroides sp.]
MDINHTGKGETDKGAPIIATRDGTVTRVVRMGSGDKDAGDNRAQITSKDKRVSTSYMHLDAISSGIKIGSNISEGQQIGNMGGSGKGKSDTYASHLHYEIKIDGVNINPANGANHLVDAQKVSEPEAALPEVTIIAPILAPKPIPMPEINRL